MLGSTEVHGGPKELDMTEQLNNKYVRSISKSVHFSIYIIEFLLKRTGLTYITSPSGQTFATSTGQEQYTQLSDLPSTTLVFILVTQDLAPHR